MHLITFIGASKSANRCIDECTLLTITNKGLTITEYAREEKRKSGRPTKAGTGHEHHTPEQSNGNESKKQAIEQPKRGSMKKEPRAP